VNNEKKCLVSYRVDVVFDTSAQISLVKQTKPATLRVGVTLADGTKRVSELGVKARPGSQPSNRAKVKSTTFGDCIIHSNLGWMMRQTHSNNKNIAFIAVKAGETYRIEAPGCKINFVDVVDVGMRRAFASRKMTTLRRWTPIAEKK
jgi:hypothetical protein